MTDPFIKAGQTGKTEELVRAIRQWKDAEENFRRLFEHCHPRVYRFFLRKGNPPEDARDLTQETFFSVYKGLKELRDEAQFESWLFSIALNVWRTHLETKKARKRAGAVIPLDQELTNEAGELSPLSSRIADTRPDPLEMTLENEKLEKLREAMQQLPDQMRRCAQLRVINDLSYQEIADLMGISINTVKAHLHQAQKVLRERLSAYFGEIEV